MLSLNGGLVSLKQKYVKYNIFHEMWNQLLYKEHLYGLPRHMLKAGIYF